MVQEFHVLRCFTCHTFQVQQVKKVNKWSCKLCGEKQSLLKEFGRGSGADCRRHVQRLNAMRGAMMEEQEHNTWSLWEQVEADGEDGPEGQRDDQVTHSQVSCWSKYLETPEEAEPEEKEEADNVLIDRQQLHGNNLIDRKRKRSKGWTDRGGQDSWTPEQANWSVRPSTKTRTTSLTHTSPPNLTHTSPPSKSSTNPPSVAAGSTWACFLSSDCQVNEERKEQTCSGRSLLVGGAATPPCDCIISQAPPLTRPRPSVSSMFQSGDEFNFDDEFLTNF